MFAQILCFLIAVVGSYHGAVTLSSSLWLRQNLKAGFYPDFDEVPGLDSALFRFSGLGVLELVTAGLAFSISEPLFGFLLTTCAVTHFVAAVVSWLAYEEIEQLVDLD